MVCSLFFAFCSSRSCVLPFLPVVLSLSVVDLFANHLFHKVLWLPRKISTEGFELNWDENLDRAVFIFGILFFVSNQDPLIPGVVRHGRLWFSWSSILATLGACTQNLESIGVEMEEIGCFSCDSRLFSERANAATAPNVATVASLRPVLCYGAASAAAVSCPRLQCLVRCYSKRSPNHCVCTLFHLVWARCFIRFKFRFLRWFSSSEWIFSKHLCHLLAQVFKVGPLPLFCRGGGFLYWSARLYSFSRLLGGVPVYRFLSVTLCFLETSSLL
jgi:hypothetical protein